MIPTPPEFFTIRLKNFEPSWVGRNPFELGFAIGAVDGSLAFTDEMGVVNSQQRKSPTKDAINGLARIDEYLAVSTAQEVSIFSASTRSWR